MDPMLITIVEEVCISPITVMFVFLRKLSLIAYLQLLYINRLGHKHGLPIQLISFDYYLSTLFPGQNSFNFCDFQNMVGGYPEQE